MEGLLSKIGQLAVFLICAQTLVHFRPKKSYEKYIKLLVSMMLLILLVEPVMDFLGKGEKGDFLERIFVYEQKLEEILISPQLDAGQIEGILQNILQQRVNEGSVYVQEQSQEAKAVNGTAVGGESQPCQDASKEEIIVQVEVAEIEEVRVNAGDGKSAGNY